MAILTILEFPDPRLRTLAKPVIDVDDSVKKLIDDMFETMYAAPGIGLAATQVNVHQQIVVMDISEEHDDPLVFINPQIAVLADDTLPYDEGCLSVPGFYETVERPAKIRVNALDRNGEAFILEPDGLLATCIQHELDHLKGKLFVDYVSAMKRSRIRKKLEKAQRQNAK
jgi:peptide deformylase